MLEGPRATAAGKSVFFMKCKAMKKIKLLSVDAIKAIYEREMAKQGLPADCDETKLAEIVRNVEQIIPPGVAGKPSGARDSMPFYFLLFWMLVFSTAQAGPIPVPDLDQLKAYATAVTEEGLSLKALNYVQDTRKCPHVTALSYDREADRFYWQGPVTGKLISMDRERFFREIWSLYSDWCDQHNCD